MVTKNWQKYGIWVKIVSQKTSRPNFLYYRCYITKTGGSFLLLNISLLLLQTRFWILKTFVDWVFATLFIFYLIFT